MIEISVLPEPESHPLWPEIRGLLEPAARLSGSPVWEDGQVLWVAIENRMIVAAVTTCLNVHGEAELWHIGGQRAAEWLPDMDRQISSWARDCGAERLLAQGRMGWGRLSAPLGWVEYRRDGKTRFYEKVL